MSKQNDFKDLANRAYMAYHEDGIIDILLGAGITGFGLQMLFESSALIILSWMPFLFYVPMKNHITAPRFGYVRFAGEQEERTRNTRIILLGLLTFTLFLGLFVALTFDRVTPEMRALIGQNMMLLLGGLAALILAVAAAVTGLKRFYIYAALTLLFNIAGTFLPIHEGLTTVLLGLTILICGIWLLVRFLRAYPLPEEEDGLGR
jgi:hypothetical protein